jgi:hypothetical protein
VGGQEDGQADGQVTVSSGSSSKEGNTNYHSWLVKNRPLQV